MTLVVAGVLLVPFVALALRVHRFGRQTSRAHAVTAVVLGARVYADGTPSQALIDRVAVGAALFTSGRVQRLLLTGGSPDSRPTEAEVMARLAIANGIPAAALMLENTAASTRDNARKSAGLLFGRDSEVLLVTCDFHLARACAQFVAHGLTPRGVPSPRSLTAATRLMVTAKEVMALLRAPSLIFRIPTVASRGARD